MRILAVAADQGGCGWYRIRLPYSILGRRGHDVQIASDLNWGPNGLVTVNEQGQVVPYRPDVVVVQRPGTLGMVKAIKEVHRLDLPFVSEIDDLIWNIPGWNPAHKTWQTKQGSDKKSEHLEALMQVFRDSDAMTVSTEPLAAEARKKWPGKPIYVTPNCLPMGHWQVPDRTMRIRTGEIHLGWAGSHHHSADLQVIAGLPGQVLEKHPRAKLVLIGGYAEAKRLLARNLPHERIIEYGWLKVREVERVLQTIDIGLAPLDSHVFNDSKSDLKAIEYGAVGAPTIATPRAPYKATIRHGENGFLCRRPDEWLRAMDTLLGDSELMLRMGKEARSVSEWRDIGEHVVKWEQALQDVVDRHRRRGALVAPLMNMKDQAM